MVSKFEKYTKWYNNIQYKEIKYYFWKLKDKRYILYKTFIFELN